MSDARVDVFAISAATTPGLRDAIGSVCVHWALLEFVVERVIAFQTRQSIEVTYERDFGGNMAFLEKYLKDNPGLGPVLVEEWVSLIKEGRRLAKERHRIVHGLWHVEGDTIISFFPELKSKGRKIDAEQRMTVEGIHEFKRSLFKLGRLWAQFASPSDEAKLKWSIA